MLEARCCVLSRNGCQKGTAKKIELAACNTLVRNRDLAARARLGATRSARCCHPAHKNLHRRRRSVSEFDFRLPAPYKSWPARAPRAAAGLTALRLHICGTNEGEDTHQRCCPCPMRDQLQRRLFAARPGAGTLAIHSQDRTLQRGASEWQARRAGAAA